jgi:hypothetical protein
MSRSDLHRSIQANWDAINRHWLVIIPLDCIEEQMYREGRRFVGRMPSHEEMNRQGVKMGEEIAKVMAAPGPVQRAVRKQIAANNRRRFGP